MSRTHEHIPMIGQMPYVMRSEFFRRVFSPNRISWWREGIRKHTRAIVVFRNKGIALYGSRDLPS